jgi:hypothetical protein
MTWLEGITIAALLFSLVGVWAAGNWYDRQFNLTENQR